MDSNDHLSYLEKRLSKEIEDVDTQIQALQTERHVLQKQLAKARAERTGLQAVTRKNSLNRVLAENSVVEFIKARKRACSTKELFNYARITNYELKDATFRTYLHRMKARGLIKPAKAAGSWELPVPKPGVFS